MIARLAATLLDALLGRGDWMETFSGRKYYPASPRSEDVRIVDVAHHLSMICRYTGAVKKFYCVTPDTRVLAHDLTWVPAGDIKDGQMLWGFDEEPVAHRKLRKWRPSTARVHGQILREVVELRLTDGTVLKCSAEHPLLASTKAAGNQKWVTAGAILSHYDRGCVARNQQASSPIYLPRFVNTWEPDTSWHAGWLAGMFDGEGSLTSKQSRAAILTIAQNEGDTLAGIETELRKRASFYKHRSGQYKCKQLSVLGGLSAQLALLGSIRPQRLIAKMLTRMVGRDFMRAGKLVAVVSARSLGVLPVVALETSTHTYITEGFASHNSVAEHSVLVSYCVPKDMALAALLHDAQEAYITDISRPLKHSLFMAGYRWLEYRNWLAIADYFMLPHVLPREIKEADNAVLLTERMELMPWTNREWSIPGECADVEILGLAPEAAEKMFLERYYELTRGRIVCKGAPADNPLEALNPCYALDA